MRVDAVIALRSIVEAYSDEHLVDMKPHLPSLLEHLFRLMSEVSFMIVPDLPSSTETWLAETKFRVRFFRLCCSWGSSDRIIS